MDAEAGWSAIAAQRLAIADLLDDLPPADWERPSLCAGWRVRDVAAHLTLAPQPPAPATMLREAVRARGSFHRFNHDFAVGHAERHSPAELVAQLRTHAASRRLPALTSYANTVFDVVVHGQDMARPLGRTIAVPAEVAAAAATRVWAMGWPFHARRRLRGTRLVATDTDWTAGTGTELRAPILDLLMVLTGRPRQ